MKITKRCRCFFIHFKVICSFPALKMKIVSWNINGIRASKTDLKSLFKSIGGDVLCLQETKVTRVANFCRDHVTPTNAEEGLSGGLSAKVEGIIGCYGNHTSFTEDELKSLDAEGRAVITQHRIRFRDGEEKDLAIINVYCPRFDPDREDRHQYKLRFFALLQTRAEALLDSGRHVIILGDINTTHRLIDRCDSDDGESNKRPSRLWFNQMMWPEGRDPDLDSDLDREEFMATTPYTVGGKFVDTFRHLHPDEEGCYTNWCTLTNARSTNYGRRLDYILADTELTRRCVIGASIFAEVEGSDHCPISVDLDCQVIPAKACPQLCTKFMPEFSGKQQKLSTFFTKLTKRDVEMKINEKCENCSQNRDESLPRVSSENLSRVKSVKRSPEKKPGCSQPMKKQKTAVVKKSNSVGKQANLMSFFKGNGSDSKDQVKSEVAVSIGANDVKESQVSSKLSVFVEVNEVEKEDTAATSKYFNVNSQTATDGCEGSEEKKPELGTTLVKDNSLSTASAWKNLLGGLGPAPLCKGHQEPCVLRMVKKPGPNKGRQFYTCARGEGLKSNPEARCEFFKWIVKK
ncbi:APEX2-like protein [Mya arenaria]|uniref:DNA-(apurinic or apyrimidinic site) endonuclease n=1 Tax=Mya arenaria TaxID=6604 RepID=A0ABY7FUB7_MYAAR|nr:APEX2-like protein [Mya arenaria]